LLGCLDKAAGLRLSDCFEFLITAEARKRAILVLASGGVFSEGPWKSWDTVEPYLRLILGFIGIHDVQTVRAQGMNIPGISDNAIPDGEKTIEALAL
jgi:FMN-dependent NADH-azoreductase